MNDLAKNPTSETLWDTADVALYLKMSKSWVYHASERGELPHIRIGASLRFHPERIKAWAESAERPSGTMLHLPSAKMGCE